VDTDVGLGDVAAIALLAASKAPVSLFTTMCGICRPGVGSANVHQLVSALGMLPAACVVAGGEDRRRTAHEDWEREQQSTIASLCAELGGAEHLDAVHTQPSAEAAADAILDVARSKAQGTHLTVLALGATTNLGLAAQRDPNVFSQIDEIVFVGGVRTTVPNYHHQPYNAWLDPDALRQVLRSGVPLRLIGYECYPKLPWCNALMAARAVAGEATAADAPLSARILWRVFRSDPRQMSFDPLAVFYLEHPEAFVATESMSVRVTTGAHWRYEQCANSDAPDAHDVVELAGVALDEYAAWLTSALTQPVADVSNCAGP